MRHSLHRPLLVSLTLLAIPALYADVTLRYKSEVKLNPTLPPAITEQSMKGMQAAMPPDSSIQFKNGKGISATGGIVSLCDFTRKEITLLDKDGKRFATLPFDKLGDEFAAAMPQMPEQAKAMAAGMKTHSESKLTGRTATIQGIEAEEHEVTMTVDAPAMPNVPAGPMMKMVMHFWLAKASEALRVPAVRELTGYNLFAVATMNPAASMQKIFQRMPGADESFVSIYNAMQNGKSAPVMLRLQMDMYMPMMAAMMKANPQAASALGGNFDPEAPFLQMNQEVAEISTATIPDSVFQVPEGYQSAPAADIIKAMMSRMQAAAK